MKEHLAKPSVGTEEVAALESTSQHALGSHPADGQSGLPYGREALVPPRWVPPVSMAISALAAAGSAYLTYSHFTTPKVLACSTKGFINCAAVTTSSYSHPFGIPIALAGLVWSFVMLALCTPWAWRAASPWLCRARLAGTAAGLVSVFYLLWAELIKLHHLCEYCTVVHVLTFGLFVVVLFGTALALPATEQGLTPEKEPDLPGPTGRAQMPETEYGP